MNPTDEMLIAYADGELSGEEARAVEAQLRNRPDLQAFVERQRALRRGIESAFAPLMNEDVPDRIMNALARTPVSHRWRLRRALNEAARLVSSRQFVFRSALPAAAALACGIFLGIVVAPQGAFRVDRETGGIFAQGELAATLDDRLASAQTAGESIRVGISFKAKDGHYCRTFQKAGAASSLAGVACRAAQGWSVAALATTPAEQGAYRMAGAMPAVIRGTVDKLISGEPLDAAGERRARDLGWRTH